MNNGERIKQVRELLGWTQTELATKLNKDQSLIAQTEGGRKEPSDDLIKAVAFATGFPPGFFRQDGEPDFPFGSLALRAHASLTRREKLQAYRYAQIVFEFLDKTTRDVTHIRADLPKVDVEPAEAAKILRSHFGLSPDRPIRHLVNVLEKAGILLIILPIKLTNLDAFSLWAGSNKDTPVIGLAAERPGDRIRFSLSHELWHLISAPVGKPLEIERNADIFAAEFLTPQMGIRQEITYPVTLTLLAELKARWGISMQSLIRRAVELGIVTQRQYFTLMQQMSVRGWRIKEPVVVPAETPMAVPRILDKTSISTSHLPSQFTRNIFAAYKRASSLTGGVKLLTTKNQESSS